MTIEDLTPKVLEWAAMRYFPSREDRSARLAIIKQVAAMAGTFDRACWIVDQMLTLTSDWPGIAEVRGVFCKRFRPADGVEADSKLCLGETIPPEQAVGFIPLPAIGQPTRDPRDRSVPVQVRRLIGSGPKTL